MALTQAYYLIYSAFVLCSDMVLLGDFRRQGLRVVV